jgi:hypothetical protein
LSPIGKACGGQIDGILGVDLLDAMGMTIDLKRRIAVPAVAGKPENSRKALLAEFRSAVIEIGELQDGFTFRLPGNGKWIGVIAELLVAARECCPFLAFQMAALPNMGPLIVRVTGPPGTKEFLRTILCNSVRQLPPEIP